MQSIRWIERVSKRTGEEVKKFIFQPDPTKEFSDFDYMEEILNHIVVRAIHFGWDQKQPLEVWLAGRIYRGPYDRQED